jgi:hypothetical protein
MVEERNHRLWEQIYGKNKCLWEQSHMIVGTKTYS